VEEQNLGRVASDFFASVLLITESTNEQSVDPADLRAQLLSHLDHVIQHPLAQHLDAAELENIRFALVAWADEMLLKSTWPGRDPWAKDLLQSQLFRTNRGGDEFYERLERLRPDQNAARMVFFLCLVFGFEGQLTEQDAELGAKIQQHYNMLRAAGAASDSVHIGRLAPEAYQLKVTLEAPASGSIGRIFLCWAGIAGATFLVLWSVLAFMAGRIPQPPGA